MNSSTTAKLPVYLFSGLVLINCLVFSAQIIDPTLVIRFSFLAVFITGFTAFLIFYFKKSTFKIDLISGVFFGFVLYSILSLIWTFNTSLAIIDVSKTILFFFVLLISNLLLDKYGSDFISVFVKFVTGLLFISILPFIYNVVDLNSFSRENMYDVFTISGHKNLYSSFLYLISIFSILGLFYLKKSWKSVLIISIIIQLILVIILQARAVYMAYFTFIATGFILFILHRLVKSVSTKSIVYIVVLSMVLFNAFFIVVFPTVIQLYVENLSTQLNSGSITSLSTISERSMLWEKTYLIISENMYLGIGGGNWSVFYPSFSLPDVYKATDLNTIFQRPHNDFLGVFSEYGIIGLNSFYLFIVLIISFLYKNLISNYHPKFIILIAGIMGYLVISFFSFPGERIEHNLLLFTLFGISIYHIKKHIPFFTEKQINLKFPVLWVVVVASSIIFYFSFLNLKGEYLTRQIQIQKSAINYSEVINLCTEAESFCYQLDPTSMPLNWYKGNAFIKLNLNEKALSSFKISVTQNPYNQYVLNDLASGYYMMNQMDSAKYFYMESSRINPRFDDPKLNLTAIYINEGDFDSAKKWNDSILHDSERRDYYYHIISESNN